MPIEIINPAPDYQYNEESNKTLNILVHNVDVITPQGLPGKDGHTPYIDKVTGHWFINGVDTGVSAAAENQLIRVNTKYDLPLIGNSLTLYLTEDTYDLYAWKEETMNFLKIGSNIQIDVINCGTSAIQYKRGII